jgi:hypothetical protein
MGAAMSHNPLGLHGLLQGRFILTVPILVDIIIKARRMRFINIRTYGTLHFVQNLREVTTVYEITSWGRVLLERLTTTVIL